MLSFGSQSSLETFFYSTDTRVYTLQLMERNIKTWIWCLQWRGHHEALVGGRSHWPLITRYQEGNVAILPLDGNEGWGMKANPLLDLFKLSRRNHHHFSCILLKVLVWGRVITHVCVCVCVCVCGTCVHSCVSTYSCTHQFPSNEKNWVTRPDLPSSPANPFARNL